MTANRIPEQFRNKFDTKIEKMANVFLEQLQNSIAKTFGSTKFNHGSTNDDSIKIKDTIKRYFCKSYALFQTMT